MSKYLIVSLYTLSHWLEKVSRLCHCSPLSGINIKVGQYWTHKYLLDFVSPEDAL